VHNPSTRDIPSSVSNCLTHPCYYTWWHLSSTNRELFNKCVRCRCGMEQLLVRLTHIRSVVGSNSI